MLAGDILLYVGQMLGRGSELFWHTLQELKVQGTSFIVAPYEADAQMAYLAKRGDVQLVLTEDSDLLAYGCPR